MSRLPETRAPVQSLDGKTHWERVKCLLRRGVQAELSVVQGMASDVRRRDGTTH